MYAHDKLLDREVVLKLRETVELRDKEAAVLREVSEPTSVLPLIALECSRVDAIAAEVTLRGRAAGRVQDAEDGQLPLRHGAGAFYWLA